MCDDQGGTIAPSSFEEELDGDVVDDNSSEQFVDDEALEPSSRTRYDDVNGSALDASSSQMLDLLQIEQYAR